jgi:acetolactate synthase regulatory subunit
MRFRWHQIHPLLFAIFPTASLYAINADQLVLSVTYRPLLLFVGVTAALWLCFGLAFKSIDKGALMTTGVLILSYTVSIFWKTSLASPRFLQALPVIKHGLFFGTPLAMAGLFYALLQLKHVRTISRTASFAGLILLTSPLIQIGLQQQPSWAKHESPLLFYRQPGARHHAMPNIYYIILDGYGREDVLKEYFDFDNGRFIRFLKDRGFYVCTKSRSNYAHTLLSLSSSLNMEYIPQMEKEEDQVAAATEMIRYNRVSQFLRNKGYRIIHMNSGWIVTAANAFADVIYDSSRMDEFDATLLSNVVPKFLVDKILMNHERKTTLYNLSKLKDVPTLPGAKFTFAHLICPHPPFVFNRTGQFPSRKDVMMRVAEGHWRPKSRYIDQLVYMNYSMEKIIDTILKQSATPPIIILQSDHGPASDGIQDNPSYLQVHERTTILNAYYVPDAIRAKLYPGISPVNSFRLIFDGLFKAHYPLLPDRSYYSPQGGPPFTFIDLTHYEHLRQERMATSQASSTPTAKHAS